MSEHRTESKQDDRDLQKEPVWDRSIRSFLQEAGEATPTPGGGSVAALVGALGASMTAMAAGFTLGAKYAEREAEVREALERLRELSATCEDLLEGDIVCFERYMAAIRLPKSTEEEKERRSHAIREATLDAVGIPLRLMQACEEALAVAAALAPFANKNVISDLGIGAVLFEAAAESALLTVEINLAAMPPSDRRDEFDRSSRETMARIRERKAWTAAEVRRRILT